MMKTFLYISVLSITAIFFLSCSSSAERDVDFSFLEKDEKVSLINHIFDFTEKKSLVFPDSVLHSFSFAASMVFSESNIMQIDQRMHRIYLFDRNGNYLSTFGREGRGPGEFTFIQSWFYENGKLYLYDSLLQRFTVLGIPDLELVEEINIKIRISDFVVFDDKMVAITPFGEKGILSLLEFKNNGEVIDQTQLPQDSLSTIFFAARNNGDLKKSGNNTVLFLYPDGDYFFEYHVLENNLILDRVYTFGDVVNDFRPKPLPFPENLDPYNYSDQHVRWLESASHFHWLNILKPDIISAMGIQFENTGENNFFLNLYRLDGSVVAEGVDLTSDSLRFPFNAKNEFLIFPLSENSSESELQYYLVRLKK